MANIVLIEDELNIRRNTKIILENAGYNVHDARSGEEGLCLIDNTAPDLIVCDIMLPGISGYDVLQCSLNNPGTIDIPFIFLSARSEFSDIRKGMEMGADDYLRKPFNAADLIKAVESRINKKNRLNNISALRNIPVRIPGKDTRDKDYLTILANNKNVSIKFNDIVFIKAEREYSKVFLSSGSAVTTCRVLKKWEPILPVQTFLRIHRSEIININFIDKIEKFCKRSLLVHFKGINEKAIVSQRYAARLKRNHNIEV